MDEFRFRQGEFVFDELRGRLTEHHSAGWAYRLHSLRQPDMSPDSRVSNRSRTDFSRNNFAGVQPDPQLQVNPVAAHQFGRKSVRLRLNFESGKTSATGMILKRSRNSEQCHNPVTCELVQCATEAVYNRRRAVDQSRHDFTQSLWTENRGDVHGPHHICKQNGDLLVFGGFDLKG